MDKILNELEEDFRHLVSQIDFASGYDPFNSRFMKAALVGQMWCTLKCLEGDVEDELSGARKYMETYLETGDSAYKEMAGDELRHAGILIKRHMTDPSKVEEMKGLEKERQELQKEVSSLTIPVQPQKLQ